MGTNHLASSASLQAVAIVSSFLIATSAVAQNRAPIAEFKNGFTTQQLEEFRSNYTLPFLLSGGDASVWWSMRTSEVMQTAVLPVRQATMQLEKALNPKIGKITADTKNFGSISLDDFMLHPESYAAAFIVVHKGQVVYETYP